MTTQQQEKHKALPAPGQDSVHSHFEGRDHEQDHGRGEHEEVIPKDLKPASTLLMLVAGIVIICCFVALFFLGFVPHEKRKHAAEDQAKAVNDSKPVVQVKAPTIRSDTFPLNLPADVRAFQDTSIFARATGFLNKQLVDIGDKVEANQLLATIDQPDVVANLEQAKATLGQAQANLTKAKNDNDLAQTTLKRYEGFAATGGVTQQSLDEKRSAAIEAESTLAASAATVKAGDANVARLQTLVNFGTINAPFTGVITARGYDLGALISPSSTIAMYSIADVATLRVFVNVPQTFITSIKIGQSATVAVSNYPKEAFAGTVTRSAGALNNTTRTQRYEIDVPNKDARLSAGMYGTATLPIAPVAPPLIVPASALVFDSTGTKVWTIDGENKAHAKVITIGKDFGQDMEVLKGLDGKEQIVTNPGLRLADGAEVTVVQPQSQVASR